MTYKSQLGNLGENLACEYLVNNGYKIINRNFRKPWGEIDIIAKSSDKTLVFIEVKTMKFFNTTQNNQALQPEDQLTSAKLQKLKRTASLYAGHRQELIDDEKGWRIDLIAITIKANGEFAKLLTIKEKSCVIKHYENIG